MRILVTSPHTTGAGNSTVSILLAGLLARDGKSVCLTHTRQTSNSFKYYMKLTEYEDRTSTPSQIVNLIRNHGLKTGEEADYCKRSNVGFDVFTTDSESFDTADMEYVHEYIAKKFPHEHVIFDDDGTNLESTKKIAAMCDVAVLVMTQSLVELKAFNGVKKAILTAIGNTPTVVVINKYNSIKCSIDNVAATVGAKPRGWLAFHDNPWITYSSNLGDFKGLLNCIIKSDSRVIELKADSEKIISSIIKAKSARHK